MTFAPRKRISLHRSMLNGSAMVITSGYPLAAQIMARPMAYPRISTCRLDDRLARLEFSRLLGRFNHPEGQSVLN
jgi:hypothetical protein